MLTESIELIEDSIQLSLRRLPFQKDAEGVNYFCIELRRTVFLNTV
jgi:hypothetical protein